MHTINQREPINFAALMAWLIVGFNVGVVMVIMMALVVVPLVFPEFSIGRGDTPKVDASSGGAITFILITNTPEPIILTPQPTQQPTDDIPPTSEITQASLTPAVVITLASDFVISTPTLIPPSPTPIPPPASYRLEGIKFFKQGWNNCGPANLAMGLSYYRWEGTQADTAEYLKPNREDRNVSPQQMVDYVNTFTDLRAIWRMGGRLDQLKWLIANDFVVIVESGYDPRTGEGWYGHYETLISYNDGNGTITVYDSYLGRPSTPSVTRTYAAFDSDWQAFNRNYIVIYPAYREAELSRFLGADWIEANNRASAAETARQEATENPNNGFAWFNLGTSLTAMGRYDEAVVAYRQAFELELPWRMMWYQFGALESLLQTSRLDEVLLLANETLETTIYVEELYYYKGRVFEIRENYTAAAEQYNEALQLNPNYSQAKIALQRVQGS